MGLYLDEISFPEIKKISDNLIFSNIRISNITKTNPTKQKLHRFPETQKSEFLLFLLASNYGKNSKEELKEYLMGLGINTDYLIPETNTKYLDILNETTSLNSLIRKNNIIKITEDKPKYVKQFVKVDPITNEKLYSQKKTKYSVKSNFYKLNPLMLLLGLVEAFENVSQDFKNMFKVDLNYNTIEQSTKNDMFEYSMELENLINYVSDNNLNMEYLENENKKLDNKYKKKISYIQKKLEESKTYYVNFLNDYNKLFEEFYNSIINDEVFLKDISFIFSTYIKIIFANNLLRLFTQKYDIFKFKDTFKYFLITISESNFSKKSNSNDFEFTIAEMINDKQIDVKKLRLFQKLCQKYSELENYNVYKIQPNSKLIF